MIFGRYNTAPGVFLAADLDYLPELRSTTLKHFLKTMKSKSLALSKVRKSYFTLLPPPLHTPSSLGLP